MLFAIAVALAACSATPPMPPPGPVVASIEVVERGRHTDVCIRREDADAWVLALAQGFDTTRFICVGFGEREYMVGHDHSTLAMLSALLPSQAALIMTALRDRPGVAFPDGTVVSLGVSGAGLAGLQAFLRTSTQTDAAGSPVRLADGPYPGSVFYAATATYDGLANCNTWTADALRSAGLPVNDAVLFSSEVMRQAQRLAATQAAGRP